MASHTTLTHLQLSICHQAASFIAWHVINSFVENGTYDLGAVSTSTVAEGICHFIYVHEVYEAKDCFS